MEKKRIEYYLQSFFRNFRKLIIIKKNNAEVRK